ncbi:MAG: hypothetical protein HOV81_42070 [Kofleriaceae bacterium]|nr:hypothetical protein [Kofleriaceae bacterium]
MTRALVCLLALAACNDYAHRSTLNAPGTIDLSTPPAIENGDPSKIELPGEPGATTIAVIPAPYVGGGIGRFNPGNDGSGEVGMDIRVERTSNRGGRNLLAAENWGVTFGFAFAQWGDGVRTVAPGAFSAELNYRFLASAWPIDVGMGPAVYVDDTAVGGQLSVRCAVALLRARYVANTGGELIFGLQIPIPFFFSWSR